MSKVQEYSEELLDLISEYDEPSVQVWINNNYFIESMVFIHRHISAQLRYLLVKNYDQAPTNITCIEFIEVVNRMDNSDINRFAYLIRLITKTDLLNLKSLNTMRNQFVHPSDKRNDYSETQIKNILQEAINIEKKLSLII